MTANTSKIVSHTESILAEFRQTLQQLRQLRNRIPALWRRSQFGYRPAAPSDNQRATIKPHPIYGGREVAHQFRGADGVVGFTSHGNSIHFCIKCSIYVFYAFCACRYSAAALEMLRLSRPASPFRSHTLVIGVLAGASMHTFGPYNFTNAMVAFAFVVSMEIVQNAVNSKDHTIQVKLVKEAGLVNALEGKDLTVMMNGPHNIGRGCQGQCRPDQHLRCLSVQRNHPDDEPRTDALSRTSLSF